MLASPLEPDRRHCRRIGRALSERAVRGRSLVASYDEELLDGARRLLTRRAGQRGKLPSARIRRSISSARWSGRHHVEGRRVQGRARPQARHLHPAASEGQAPLGVLRRRRINMPNNPMTYCLGILLDEGLVLASDSRSNAGIDQVQAVCKLAVIAQPGERVILIQSAGNLATTQWVVAATARRRRGQRGKPRPVLRGPHLVRRDPDRGRALARCDRPRPQAR